jgi:hypothetical protein
MNEANYAVLNYLTNEYGIKDVSIEGVEDAIDLIFNFNDLLPTEQHLFNSIMLQALDFEWISEQLTNYLMEEEMKKLDAQREDYYDNK